MQQLLSNCEAHYLFCFENLIELKFRLQSKKI